MSRSRRRPAPPARAEGGYAMIVTVILASVLSILLTVTLVQALHNDTASSFGAKRARGLGVAEAGVNWAIAALQSNPAGAVVSNRAVPVVDGTGGTASATVTVRQGTPASLGKLGYYTIYSTGRGAQAGSPTRTLQVVMGPAASFTAALHAASSLTIEQNACIVGTVVAKGDIFFKNNATIAGTARARGSLISEHGVIREFGGANQAKCPSTVDGEPVDATKDVHGDVLAGGGTLSPCRPAPAGAVDAPAQGFNLNGATVGGRVCNDPPPTSMPPYTFSPSLYAAVAYYGQPPGYGQPSANAVATFNAALASGTLPAGAGGALDRTYVIWQDLTASQAAGTTPPALTLDTGTLRIARDTVIYTNVPVDFGNTTRVEAAQPCSTQDPPAAGLPPCPTFQVITGYRGAPCTGGVGNCPSIRGGNQIEFRPEVAVLLYSPEGTIELKNSCNSAACNQSNQGAFYASTIDAKNNLNVSYTPRIAYALGFGRTQLQQVSWQEVVPCPAGQTPPC